MRDILEEELSLYKNYSTRLENQLIERGDKIRRALGILNQYKRDTKTREDQRNGLIQVREFAGLPVQIKAWVTCLKCGQYFYSQDKKTIRICRRCKEISESALDRI